MSVIESEKSSNRKKSKNISSSSQMDQEELISNETEDFISKAEREVIKVPNCSYSNEAKSLSKYFLCICSTSPKGFEPIEDMHPHWKFQGQIYVIADYIII